MGLAETGTDSKKTPNQQESQDSFHKGPAPLFASLNLLITVRKRKPNFKAA